MNKMYYLHFNNLKKKKISNFEYILKPSLTETILNV